MKVIFVLCTLAFAFGLISTNSAFGEIYTEYPRFHEMNLQVIHRNANGDFLGYYESALAYVTNEFLLHEYLDTINAKEIIKKNGQTLEVFIIKQNDKLTENFNGQFSTFYIVYEDNRPLKIRYDGFFGESGDLLAATLKIVRFTQ